MTSDELEKALADVERWTAGLVEAYKAIAEAAPEGAAFDSLRAFASERAAEVARGSEHADWFRRRYAEAVRERGPMVRVKRMRRYSAEVTDIELEYVKQTATQIVLRDGSAEVRLKASTGWPVLRNSYSTYSIHIPEEDLPAVRAISWRPAAVAPAKKAAK